MEDPSQGPQRETEGGLWTLGTVMTVGMVGESTVDSSGHYSGQAEGI